MVLCSFVTSSIGADLDIIFVDEQTAKVNGHAFTALMGFRIPATEYPILRERLVIELSAVLQLVTQGQEQTRFVKNFPVLHGTDFLNDYSDSIKIEALHVIFSVVANHNVTFSRIGYFHDSDLIKGQALAKEHSAKSASFFGLWAALWKKERSPAVVVSELDVQSLRHFNWTSTSKIPDLFNLGKESASLPVDKMIGHFFALKDEIGCQVADLALYAALKSMSSGSEYHNAVGDKFSLISDRFEVDRIIWWNDTSKSVLRV